MLYAATDEPEYRVGVEFYILDLEGDGETEINCTEDVGSLRIDYHDHHGVLAGDGVATNVPIIVCKLDVHHHGAVVESQGLDACS